MVFLVGFVEKVWFGFGLKTSYMFPTPQLLKKVSQEIKNIPNRRGEHLRKVHYGCFLLCHKSGLRVSEAMSFDLENKTRQDLYRIQKPKGRKERLVYIPKKVIRELRKNNWQPNQTNRWNFYHFLRKIKRELNISGSVELTPHTLRRSFATYHAESGLSLPILAKMLGHASVRTTALYWQNIHQEPDNGDISPILAGKKWLERQEPPPITENFPETLETPKPIFIDHKPLISNKKPVQQYNNSLSIKKTTAKSSEKLINEIPPISQETFLLNNPSKKSDQLKTTQPLALTANKKQKPTESEAILLQKIKFLESSLETYQSKLTEALQSKGKLKEKLTEIQKENNNLKQLLQQEKQRADNYQQQLKVIIKSLYQWQKNNYCQQLEKEQEAKIEQSPFKPPNK